LPLPLADRLYRKSPLAEQHHVGEFRHGFQAARGDDVGEGLPVADIDAEPAGVVRRALGGEVGAFRVELGGVGVGSAHYLGGAGNARHLAAGVVDQHTVAGGDAVPQVVAGLVVADAVPAGGATGCPGQVSDTEFGGFGFEQPVVSLPGH